MTISIHLDFYAGSGLQKNSEPGKKSLRGDGLPFQIMVSGSPSRILAVPEWFSNIFLLQKLSLTFCIGPWKNEPGTRWMVRFLSF